jgi:membrane protein implicated in regulation of membrane protease activity
MNLHIVFWYWWALSAALLVCEMMLPGVVFLFLALGAAVAGMLLVLEPEMSVEMQLVIFAVVSVASAVGLRPLLRGIQKRSDDPNLNARGNSMIGKVLVLDQPILRGRGRVILGDGSWTVTGPDMVAGAKVRVAAVDGTELRVEPAP